MAKEANPSKRKKPNTSVSAVAKIPADRAGSAPIRLSVIGIKTPTAPEQIILMTIDTPRTADNSRLFDQTYAPRKVIRAIDIPCAKPKRSSFNRTRELFFDEISPRAILRTIIVTV